MNALKNILLVGSGIAVGALVMFLLNSEAPKSSSPSASAKEAKPPVERDERELNDGFLTDEELAQKNAERDKVEQIRQSRRYWENSNDPSILRNLDRKDREFWGNSPGRR